MGFLLFLLQASPSPSAPAGGNEFTITEMVKNMGPVAITVVIILLIMSVYSIAIMVERYLTYTAAKKQSREFAPRVAQALKNNRIEEAINISDKHRKSHLAMVVNSGLQEFRAHEQSNEISGNEIKRRSARCNGRSQLRLLNFDADCLVWPRSDQRRPSSVCSGLCLELLTRFEE